MAESMNWYAVRTQNNREKSVLEKLNLEITRSGLDKIIGRHIIPTEKTFSVKNGKKIGREKIVYPGYLFIETSSVGEINNFLKHINGASGFVRTRSGDISPLKEYEVKKILNDQEENDVKTPTSIYSVDESVKIIDGPFASFKGQIRSIDAEKQKAKIEVLIFNRATMVDLDFFQIERI